MAQLVQGVRELCGNEAVATAVALFVVAVAAVSTMCLFTLHHASLVGYSVDDTQFIT